MSGVRRAIWLSKWEEPESVPNVGLQSRTWLRHVPNLITVGRAVVAIPYFVVLAVSSAPVALRVSAGLFIGSMILDVVDGWLARRWHAESILGRILDPVLDKVVICGSLVLCIAVSRELLAAWMVVVVLARELSVSAIRAYIESQGINFKATVWGKVKTASECFAIGSILIYGGMRTNPQWARTTTIVAIWVMMAVVVFSGVDYALRAYRIIAELARRPEQP